MTADLTNPVFTNEEAALAHLEASRWPNGAFCGYCGSTNVTRMKGKTQAGYFMCNDCRQKFTARVGTVLERSHVPVHKWLLAIHLLTASKKGMSAHQLHRMLGVTYKTAWFMAHRIREAMTDPKAGPIGGEGKVVEADETYFGKRENPRKPSPQRKGRPFTKRGKGGGADKRAVVALVERGGEVRMMHVEDCTAAELREILVRNVSRKSALHTDESRLYTVTGGEYASHRTVKHSGGEYVRYEDVIVHTNTVENVFSVFKRGMKGVYHHCGEAHLHRYLAEFSFRYNHRSGLNVTDAERAAAALKGIEGKRLTYRRIGEAANA
jgi:transposase-like protein